MHPHFKYCCVSNSAFKKIQSNHQRKSSAASPSSYLQLQAKSCVRRFSSASMKKITFLMNIILFSRFSNKSGQPHIHSHYSTSFSRASGLHVQHFSITPRFLTQILLNLINIESQDNSKICLPLLRQPYTIVCNIIINIFT